MARARGKPPATARAIAAYNCGARMAAWRDQRIADMVCRGESITDLMTPGEVAAHRLCTDAYWGKWWWQGYLHGATERQA